MSEQLPAVSPYLFEENGMPGIHIVKWFEVVTLQGFAGPEEIAAMPAIARAGRFEDSEVLDNFLSRDWTYPGSSRVLNHFAIDAVVHSEVSVDHKIDLLRKFADILGYEALLVEDGKRAVMQVVRSAQREAFSLSVFAGEIAAQEHFDELLWRTRREIPRQPFSHRVGRMFNTIRLPDDPSIVEAIVSRMLEIVAIKESLNAERG